MSHDPGTFMAATLLVAPLLLSLLSPRMAWGRSGDLFDRRR